MRRLAMVDFRLDEMQTMLKELAHEFAPVSYTHLTLPTIE